MRAEVGTRNTINNKNLLAVMSKNEDNDAILAALAASMRGPSGARRSGGSVAGSTASATTVEEVQGMFNLSSSVLDTGGNSGQGEARPSGKLYRLYEVQSSGGLDDACGGVKGYGGSICIKTDCGVKHRAGTTESVLVQNHLYVKKGMNNEVFEDPHINIEALSPTVFVDWMSKSYTITEWAEMFLYVSTNSQDSNTVTQEILDATETFAEQANRYRTPGKRQVESSPVNADTDTVIYEQYKKVLPEGNVTQIRSTMELEDEKNLLAEVDGGLANVATAVTALERASTKGLKSTESVTTGFIALGERFDDLDNLDLNGVVHGAGLNETVDALQERVSSLETVTKDLATERDGESIKFGDLHFTAKEEADAYLEMYGNNEAGLLVDYHTLFQHVFNQITGIKGISQMSFLKKVGTAAAAASSKTEIDALKQRLTRLEGKVK
jgi:polyhydroxyalkanoate synthesis regulator phasin